MEACLKILCCILVKTSLHFLSLAAVMLLSAELPVLAQPSNATAPSQASKAEFAQRLLAAISAARTHFIADFGPKAFDRMDFPGGKSLGNVWAEYLSNAGYPPIAERQEIAELFRAELDQSAALLLVMTPAREEATEHLVAGLKRIASGQAAPPVVRQNPNGTRFSVAFREDTSVLTRIQSNDGSSYQPRPDDEIAWQFVCSNKLPNLNSSVRGCDEKNYGYLSANSDKRPLDAAQGRYVFRGTRSTGEQMIFEGPTGYCRPIFLELKANNCTLDLRVVRQNN